MKNNENTIIRFNGNFTISGSIILISNRVYKNQRDPMTPFSGYKNTVLIISSKVLMDNGSLSSCLKIIIIKLVIKEIVKNGAPNL
nr:hypothetical protein [Clostridium gasigenes]